MMTGDDGGKDGSDVSTGENIKDSQPHHHQTDTRDGQGQSLPRGSR